ncbi:uncharacterized protein LOC119665808 [Teleopsis dalmanni]|uniref:uncharacterized protein LOC119665808 n=1 Tax=Teleopsis dalmanni TaxID=139649 RepID=UPI0018CDAF5A|nr:uncharacterized protein LOC119665808 [Teleopsis dalmanni]
MRSPAEWTIIAYYDISFLQLEVEFIKNATNSLATICDQMNGYNDCWILVDQFKMTNLEMLSASMILQPKRKKRGAIDIIGNVANAVFGVLDSEYAKQMAQTIQQLKDNDGHLIHLLKNQTSILDSTINIMKKDRQFAQSTFELTVKRMTDLQNKIQKDEDEISLLKLYQLFTAIATQLLSVTTNVQFYETAILGVLTDTNHGKISPLLLTPVQLNNEITTIREHLNPATHLPGNTSNIVGLYSLMTVTSGLVDTKILFRITLPIVRDQTFDLFSVIPIPGVRNSIYQQITPMYKQIKLKTRHENAQNSITTINIRIQS